MQIYVGSVSEREKERDHSFMRARDPVVSSVCIIVTANKHVFLFKIGNCTCIMCINRLFNTFHICSIDHRQQLKNK